MSTFLLRIDIRSYPLLETAKLSWGQRVSLANDRDDIDARRQAAHQFDIHFPQANASFSSVSPGMETRKTHA